MALRRRRAPTACAEPTTGPHTLATPCPILQWLVFGGRGAPALEPGGEPAAGDRGAALPARAGAGHARPARLRRGRLPGDPAARAPVHDRPRGHGRPGRVAADIGR